MIDLLKTFAALIATITALSGGYIAAGLPLPATRGYVQESVVLPLNEMQHRLLKTERRLYSTELYQWERANPPPRSEQVELTIDRLKQEIADIDRRLNR